MPKLHLITYGCQMNEYDSERVAGLLKNERYELTDSAEDADLILLNTCAIREKAEDKVYSELGTLRRLKARRPDVLIGVMGCMAQLRQGAIQAPRSARGSRVRLARHRPRRRAGDARARGAAARARDGRGAPRQDHREAGHEPAPEGLRHRDGGVRKTLHVLRRADHAGRERSHPPAAIVAEVTGLAERGCREVTLLGQTVNAYGRDLDPPTDLAELLEQIDEVPGIARIRFTTSNPYNLTERLIRAIRDVPKVVEYLHLPLQSGSDRILERMNRGYTRARYLELIAELKETVPDIALSTDLIVGFPGETEDDFARTVEAVETVGYDNVFAFRYSRRPGTPAAEMADQVPESVKAERNTRVLEAAVRVGAARSRALVGRVMEVLVDGASRKDAAQASGRTRCNRVVNFDSAGRDLTGEIVQVRITEALPHSLRGELVSRSADRLAAAGSPA